MIEATHSYPVAHISSSAYVNWLMTSKPGSLFVYHVGNLMYDRGMGKADRDKSLAEKAIDEVAKSAWASMEAGQTELKQRRLNALTCEYIAQKKKYVKKPRPDVFKKDKVHV